MDFKHLHTSLVVLIGILAFGTIGYYSIEDMSFFDALYMTLITISTVGFGEIQPLSPAGRMITMVVIVTSISIGGYAMAVVVRGLIEGEIRKGFERRKLERLTQELSGHIIVCGFGRIGRIICQELHADQMAFIVIEQAEDAVRDLEKLHYLHLQMDATTEEALIKAGIMKAKGLVTAVRSDANNVFITLTAKGLRPDIYVLSRTSDVRNEDKLKRAGATKVVSPYYLGGRRMAQVLKRPAVVDFIDIATMSNRLGLIMEEITVAPGSRLVGKNLIESRFRQDFGVIIVAIQRPGADMIFNPLPTETIQSDDVLVVLGKVPEVKSLCASL